ncbi:MAG: hypothetical protein K1X74_17460 [Pirellulales bacterium]|nr:hypothetical protein [Pirellulales bacterium]
MPLILEVSLARKIGLPEYGSLGASCGLKIETDAGLLAGDAVGLRQQLAQAYQLCATAVEEELNKRRSHEASGTSEAIAEPAKSASSANRRQGRASITPRQLAYLRELAAEIDACGEQRLESMAQGAYGVPLTELSSQQASGLIQRIKHLKAGTLDWTEPVGAAGS